MRRRPTLMAQMPYDDALRVEAISRHAIPVNFDFSISTRATMVLGGSTRQRDGRAAAIASLHDIGAITQPETCEGPRTTMTIKTTTTTQTKTVKKKGKKTTTIKTKVTTTTATTRIFAGPVEFPIDKRTVA